MAIDNGQIMQDQFQSNQDYTASMDEGIRKEQENIAAYDTASEAATEAYFNIDKYGIVKGKEYRTLNNYVSQLSNMIGTNSSKDNLADNITELKNKIDDDLFKNFTEATKTNNVVTAGVLSNIFKTDSLDNLNFEGNDQLLNSLNGKNIPDYKYASPVLYNTLNDRTSTALLKPILDKLSDIEKIYDQDIANNHIIPDVDTRDLDNPVSATAKAFFYGAAGNLDNLISGAIRLFSDDVFSVPTIDDKGNVNLNNDQNSTNVFDNYAQYYQNRLDTLGANHPIAVALGSVASFFATVLPTLITETPLIAGEALALASSKITNSLSSYFTGSLISNYNRNIDSGLTHGDAMIKSVNDAISSTVLTRYIPEGRLGSNKAKSAILKTVLGAGEEASKFAGISALLGVMGDANNATYGIDQTILNNPDLTVGQKIKLETERTVNDALVTGMVGFFLSGASKGFKNYKALNDEKRQKLIDDIKDSLKFSKENKAINAIANKFNEFKLKQEDTGAVKNFLDNLTENNKDFYVDRDHLENVLNDGAIKSDDDQDLRNEIIDKLNATPVGEPKIPFQFSESFSKYGANRTQLFNELLKNAHFTESLSNKSFIDNYDLNDLVNVESLQESDYIKLENKKTEILNSFKDSQKITPKQAGDLSTMWHAWASNFYYRTGEIPEPPNVAGIKKSDFDLAEKGSYSPHTNSITFGFNADTSTFVHEMFHYFLEQEINANTDLAKSLVDFADLSNIPLDELGRYLESNDKKSFENIHRQVHESLAYQFENFLSLQGENVAKNIKVTRLPLTAQEREESDRLISRINNNEKLSNEEQDRLDKILAKDTQNIKKFKYISNKYKQSFTNISRMMAMVVGDAKVDVNPEVFNAFKDLFINENYMQNPSLDLPKLTQQGLLNNEEFDYYNKKFKDLKKLSAQIINDIAEKNAEELLEKRQTEHFKKTKAEATKKKLNELKSRLEYAMRIPVSKIDKERRIDRETAYKILPRKAIENTTYLKRFIVRKPKAANENSRIGEDNAIAKSYGFNSVKEMLTTLYKHDKDDLNVVAAAYGEKQARNATRNFYNGEDIEAKKTALINNQKYKKALNELFKLQAKSLGVEKLLPTDKQLKENIEEISKNLKVKDLNIRKWNKVAINNAIQTGKALANKDIEKYIKYYTNYKIASEIVPIISDYKIKSRDTYKKIITYASKKKSKRFSELKADKYHEVVLNILRRFNLIKGGIDEVAKGKGYESALEFLAKQQLETSEVFLIPQYMTYIKKTPPEDWKENRVVDLVSILDTLKGVEAMANGYSRILRNAEDERQKEIKDTILNTISATELKYNRRNKDNDVGTGGNISSRANKKSFIKKHISEILYPRQAAVYLDGNETGGFIHDYFVSEIDRVLKSMNDHYHEVSQKVRDFENGLPKLYFTDLHTPIKQKALDSRVNSDGKQKLLERHGTSSPKELYDKFFETYGTQEKANNALNDALNEAGIARIDALDNFVTKDQVLGMLLNLGNESGRTKLMKGEGYINAKTPDEEITEDHPQVKKLVDYLHSLLDENDVKLLNTIWGSFEDIMPILNDVANIENGRKLELKKPIKRTVIINNTPYTLTGGYYPLVYDRARATDANKTLRSTSGTGNDVSGTQKTLVSPDGNITLDYNGSGIVHTNTTQAIKDVTKYYAPLDYSVSNYSIQLQRVLRYVYLRRPVLERVAMLNNPEVARAIINVGGTEVYDALKGYISDLDGTPSYHIGAISKALKFFKNTKVVMDIVGAVPTMIKGIIGITNAASDKDVKKRDLIKAIYTTNLSNRTATSSNILKYSSIMRDRIDNRTVATSEIFNNLNNNERFRICLAMIKGLRRMGLDYKLVEQAFSTIDLGSSRGIKLMILINRATNIVQYNIVDKPIWEVKFNAVLSKNIAAGLSFEEACVQAGKEADALVELTQGTGDFHKLPKIQKDIYSIGSLASIYMTSQLAQTSNAYFASKIAFGQKGGLFGDSTHVKSLFSVVMYQVIIPIAFYALAKNVQNSIATGQNIKDGLQHINIANEVASGLLGIDPFLNFANEITGVVDKITNEQGFAYKPPFESVPQGILNTIVDTFSDDPYTYQDKKYLTFLGLYGAGIPEFSGVAYRGITGLQAYLGGNASLWSIFTGYYNAR